MVSLFPSKLWVTVYTEAHYEKPEGRGTVSTFVSSVFSTSEIQTCFCQMTVVQSCKVPFCIHFPLFLVDLFLILAPYKFCFWTSPVLSKQSRQKWEKFFLGYILFLKCIYIWRCIYLCKSKMCPYPSPTKKGHYLILFLKTRTLLRFVLMFSSCPVWHMLCT